MCTKCGSTQVTADRRGFSAGKAAVGAVLLGPAGLLAGAHGNNKVLISCLACGHQWDPSELASTRTAPVKTRPIAWVALIILLLPFGACAIAMATSKERRAANDVATADAGSVATAKKPVASSASPKSTASPATSR